MPGSKWGKCKGLGIYYSEGPQSLLQDTAAAPVRRPGHVWETLDLRVGSGCPAGVAWPVSSSPQPDPSRLPWSLLGNCIELGGSCVH